LLVPGIPLVTDDVTAVSPAPVLGADTASVLSAQLGLSGAGLRSLADRGITGGAA
jgi:hypothetical protein